MSDNKFIRKIVEGEKKSGHIGFTHKLLGLSPDYNLGHATRQLQKIVNTPLDKSVTVTLPEVGKKHYKVTKELKQHVNSSLNLIRISQHHAAVKGIVKGDNK